ncbi:LysR family transcriptional regulator [Aneurinibacillus sp. REN35]|uniref:LysR family transcriptional regulator n=1 Tax=Aneurinibacillus sp. REN35 TaxID=3237286 RepID=UPI00352762E5
MEIRQLLYAVTIAEEKSFSRAADKLHLAQPSLSQQIAKLEKEIGVILFERSTSALRLTDAGERFYESAVKILDSVEQIKKEMQDMAELEKGELTVGSLPITGAHILPLVLPVFKEKYPGIQVRLVEEATQVLELLTARGKAEMSLLSLPLADDTLEWEEILEEEICLAVPPQHPLSRKERIEIRELKDETFIMLKKGQGFRNLAQRWCEDAGFSPRVVFESSNIETVQSLVAAGMGIAFVPKMVTRWSRETLTPVYIALHNPIPRRTLVMAYRRGRYRSRASQAFLATVKEVLAAMEQSSRRF